MTIDLTTGIVRILDPHGNTVGTGFVLTDDSVVGNALIVTCAHVVEDAGAEPGDAVRLVFHHTGDEATTTVEPNWWRESNAEDVTILRLTESLPEGVKPLPLGSSAASAGHQFKTFGFPDANPVGGIPGEGYILDKTTLDASGGVHVFALRSQEVTGGFSGAPVFDTAQQQVVGMIVATADPDERGRLVETAFIIPIKTVAAACPAIQPLIQPPPDPIAQRLNEYRAYILEETQYVEMKGIPLPRNVGQIPLDKVYIQLQAVEQKKQERQRETEQEELRKTAREEAMRETPISTALLRLFGEQFYRQGSLYRSDARPEPISPMEALDKHQQLVILGVPGAGKSTLLRYLARRAVEQPDGLLPILVSARDFAAAYHQNTSLSLRDFAFYQIAKHKPTTVAALQRAEEDDKLLWLVDALDEARGEFGLEAAKQARNLKGQRIITSRPVGYPGGLDRFPHFEVLPLTPKDVVRFMEDWFTLLAEESTPDNEWVEARIKWLKDELKQRPRLQPLIRSPLLLTFLVILAGDKKRNSLPETQTRGALYGEYVHRLFKAWETKRQHYLDPQKGERVLRIGELNGDAAYQVALRGFYYLGWRLHLLYYGGKSEDEPDKAHLTNRLAAYLTQRHPDLLKGEKVEDIAADIIDFWQEAGLLDTWEAEGRAFLTFRHLTFQEYAAAQILAESWQTDQKATWQWLKPRLHLPVWREVFILLGHSLPLVQSKYFVKNILRARSLYERHLRLDLRLAAAVVAGGALVEEKLAQKVMRQLVQLGRSPTYRLLLTPTLIYITGLIIFGWGLAATVELNVFVWSCLLVVFMVFWAVTVHLFWFTFLFSVESWSNIHLTYLEQLGDSRAVPALVEALRDTSRDVRAEAVAALGQIGDSQVVPNLIKALEEKDWAVSQSAARALGRLGDVQAMPALIEALHNQDVRVRQSAADALGQLGNTQAVPALIDILRHQLYACDSAAAALGQLGDTQAVPILIETLKHQDPRMRQSAAVALAQLGDAQAVPDLIEALRNGFELARRSIANAFGQVGDILLTSSEPALFIQAEWNNDVYACRSVASRRALIRAGTA